MSTIDTRQYSGFGTFPIEINVKNERKTQKSAITVYGRIEKRNIGVAAGGRREGYEGNGGGRMVRKGMVEEGW